MNADQIHQWLACDDSDTLLHLWQQADQVRQNHVGDAVHLRGLIEISNHCQRQCRYCGIRAGNSSIERYLMSQDEILACALDGQNWATGQWFCKRGNRPCWISTGSTSW